MQQLAIGIVNYFHETLSLHVGSSFVGLPGEDDQFVSLGIEVERLEFLRCAILFVDYVDFVGTEKAVQSLHLLDFHLFGFNVFLRVHKVNRLVPVFEQGRRAL